MNSERYIAEVGRIITTNFRPHEREQGMTAARAGLLVRQVLHLHPLACGYQRFSDVLRELAARGELHVANNVKGVLSVWPTNSAAAAPSARPSSAALTATWARSASPPFRKLRNALWLAFIAESPAGKRFMHKRTGEIRTGQERTPEPTDEWAEIAPIDAVAEREDAHAFLKAEGRDDNQELLAALNSPSWWRGFSEALKRTDSLLAAEWNRRRSHRVIARVEEWRKANNIDTELLYVTPPAVSTPVAPNAGERETRLRDAIISAVRQMTTEELLELRIPAKHLVLALVPELLSK